MAAHHPVDKYKLSEIDDPDRPAYLAWRGQAYAQLQAIPAYMVLFLASMAAIGGPAPIPYPAGAAGVCMRQSVANFFAHLYGCLKGATLMMVAQAMPAITTVEGIFFVLEREWNVDAPIDENNRVTSFYNDAYDDKRDGDLKAWIRAKYTLVLQCGHAIPPGVSRTAAMKLVLTSKMPSCFDEVTSRMRTEVNLTWENMRDRLLDYDKSNPRIKRERQQQALVAQTTQHMTALIATAAAKNKKNKTVADEIVLAATEDTSSFQGMCHNCGVWGHMGRNCPKPSKKGRGKGGKKGKKGGKKGKGKGKKGKGKGKKGGRKGW
jgi:hypothetical protein